MIFLGIYIFTPILTIDYGQSHIDLLLVNGKIIKLNAGKIIIMLQSRDKNINAPPIF